MELAVSARFSPVIAAARPPTRVNRASARHHGEGIHCLDRPSPGRPSHVIAGHASDRHRVGTESPGTRSGAIAGYASDRHRAQPRCGGTPVDGMPGTALGRQHGWQVITHLRGGAAQPAHAARRRCAATEIAPILAAVSGIMRLRSIWCGAADAQRVRRLYPTPAYARSTVGPLLPH
jgi:hypothetical protein